MCSEHVPYALEVAGSRTLHRLHSSAQHLPLALNPTLGIERKAVGVRKRMVRQTHTRTTNQWMMQSSPARSRWHRAQISSEYRQLCRETRLTPHHEEPSTAKYAKTHRCAQCEPKHSVSGAEPVGGLLGPPRAVAAREHTQQVALV
jgi:hypothetical protein